MRDEGRWRFVALQSYGPALRVPGYRFLAIAQVLAESGTWLYTIALLVLVYRWTGALPTVAALALAHLTPRLVVVLADRLVSRVAGYRTAMLACFLRIPLVAALAWWGASVEVGVLIASVATLGLLGAVAERSQFALVPSLVPRARLAAANALTGRLQQAGIVLGAGLAALAIALGGERAALMGAAGCLAVAWLVGIGARPRPSGAPRSQPAAPLTVRLRRPRVRLLADSIFVGAFAGLSFRVTLVDLAGQTTDDSGVVYALLLTLLGLGALAGPAPVPRLLARFGLRLSLAGMFGLQAAAFAVVALVTAVPVLALALFLSGLLVASGDLLTTTITRRLVPSQDLEGTYQCLVLVILAGQIMGALVVVGLGAVASATAIVLVLAGLCALTALGAGLSQVRAHV